MTTKAQRIRVLWEKFPDTWDKTRLIADKAGCSTAYVRVVTRQRVDGGMSRFDRAYQATEAYREYQRAYHKTRYHTDPEFRARKLAARQSLRRRNRQEAHA